MPNHLHTSTPRANKRARHAQHETGQSASTQHGRSLDKGGRKKEKIRELQLSVPAASPDPSRTSESPAAAGRRHRGLPLSREPTGCSKAGLDHPRPPSPPPKTTQGALTVAAMLDIDHGRILPAFGGRRAQGSQPASQPASQALLTHSPCRPVHRAPARSTRGKKTVASRLCPASACCCVQSTLTSTATSARSRPPLAILVPVSGLTLCACC